MHRRSFIMHYWSYLTGCHPHEWRLAAGIQTLQYAGPSVSRPASPCDFQCLSIPPNQSPYVRIQIGAGYSVRRSFGILGKMILSGSKSRCPKLSTGFHTTSFERLIFSIKGSPAPSYSLPVGPIRDKPDLQMQKSPEPMTARGFEDGLTFFRAKKNTPCR